MAPVLPHTLRAERGDTAMNNKQKHKSFENQQGQNPQKQNAGQNNVRQEIPDYGSKSQNQKPTMENKL